MPKEIVNSHSAPKAIGPYSQAVRANGFVFLSGQIPIDPLTGNLVEGGIKEQTRRVLENIRAVLEDNGYGFEYVIKTTVFLKDMNDFAEVNSIYGEYFIDNPPARSTIQVARLPKDALLEIECIAITKLF